MKLTPVQAERVCWLVCKFLRENKEILVQSNSEYGVVALYEVADRQERVVVFEGGETEWLLTEE
jgi:hypothetical protein